ncbi:hypothetical protein [Yoonia sediminilitoris]|uniref:Uncharacterized protein n=1 Tax=Yoonia sediminilitoris TaxID=1286148 RepID=A0A2T6KK12_9RHOB|nr:hypothetical protein [Yoonia sediminilitoris]PUB16307.1 hypothetical protein C8N45_103161 [Yoonia sediminilitoris]RCW96656.1 hypothetical protein DFP92_103161 [Yoonia sediminilitoris]
MLNARKQDFPPAPHHPAAAKNQNPLCSVPLDLVPCFWSNERDDLLIRGYVDGNLKVDVLFAGQHGVQALPLLRALGALKVRKFRAARRQGPDLPDITSIRLPVTVDGSWLRVFEQDESGWETHYYNLVAVGWTIHRNIIAGQNLTDWPLCRA